MPGAELQIQGGAESRGLALARELTLFEPLLDKPEPPFAALVAGARIEEKLPILENLLPRVNRLFIGGALSFTFLKAEGREIGAAPGLHDDPHEAHRAEYFKQYWKGP